MTKAKCNTVALSPKRQAQFWAKIDRRGPDECWPWTKGISRGYGAFWTGTINVPAHRIAWILTHGEIPDDLLVCHNCPGGDNPLCCNPAHLFLGTHQDNMDDRNAKGRQASGERSGPRNFPERLPRGEGHANARLTEEKVRAIRADYAAGVSSEELHVRHGVSRVTIVNVVFRRTWKHVD